VCRAEEDDRREDEVREEGRCAEGRVGLPVQEEEQRGAAEEVDDDERRQRSECVDVVDPREAARPSHSFTRAQTLGENRRHREACEREPRQGREDVEPDEDPHRQEDEDADHERGQEDTPRRPELEDEHARADVAERKKGCPQDEEGALGPLAVADCVLVEGGDDEPDRKRPPEAPLVEANRVGDELTDGPVGRRDFVWSSGHP
jgi:hypothetical protein